MTDSIVERVARALMNARSGCYVNDWKEAEWNPYVEQALKEARAAIEAMREPTDDMLHAGSQSIFHSDKDWQSNACWRAMIDAALAQPTGEKT